MVSFSDSDFETLYGIILNLNLPLETQYMDTVAAKKIGRAISDPAPNDQITQIVKSSIAAAHWPHVVAGGLNVVVHAVIVHGHVPYVPLLSEPLQADVGGMIHAI